MSYVTISPAYGRGKTRLLVRPSSGGQFGLRVEDIFKPTDGALSDDREQVTGNTLAESIFESLANAKIWTSKVAMHMDMANRDRFFRQLDRLHDAEEWMEGDQPVQLETYKNFIRFMLSDGRDSKPSLALSADGVLTAIWVAGTDRLTVEFQRHNRVSWVVSNTIGPNVERAAGITSTDRLLTNLAPYEPRKWLATK
jgi:hypothetical protein